MSLFQRILNFLHIALHHSGIKKYGANTLWMFAEKGIRVIAGLLVGTWVARYLGPEQFGILSFVIAVTAMLKPIPRLGLDGIVSRELVQNPQESHFIVSTTIFIRIFSSILFILVAVMLMYYLEDQKVFITLSCIIAIAFAFEILSEVIQFYFRSNTTARYGVMSQIAGQSVGYLSKVAFILTGSGLLWFAVANLLEMLITLLVIILFYFRKSSYFLKWKYIQFQRAIALLKESWPAILSGTFVVIYLYIDQIMLQQLLGSKEVGLYAAAVRISSLFFVFPMILGWALQPPIIQAFERSSEEYRKKLIQLLQALVISAYLIVGILYFSSDWIIDLLFGESYQQSVEVLQLHSWALVFLFAGLSRSIWILTESHLIFDMYSNIFAGILNIVLNFYLIPRLGIVGAAWATVISYSFAYIVSGLFYRPCHWMLSEQIKSLFLLRILSLKSFFDKDSLLSNS